MITAEERALIEHMAQYNEYIGDEEAAALRAALASIDEAERMKVARFSMPQGTIHSIVSGRNWNWLTGIRANPEVAR